MNIIIISIPQESLRRWTFPPGKAANVFAMRKKVMLLAAAAGFMGCGATLSQLRGRAAVDLSCAPESLQLQALDGATQVVTGCGKRAVYVEQFNNARHPTWLLNSNIEPPNISANAQSLR